MEVLDRPYGFGCVIVMPYGWFVADGEAIQSSRWGWVFGNDIVHDVVGMLSVYEVQSMSMALRSPILSKLRFKNRFGDRRPGDKWPKVIFASGSKAECRLPHVSFKLIGRAI